MEHWLKMRFKLFPAVLQIFEKGFLKLLNLLMLIKQKSLSLHRNLAFANFVKLIMVF